MITGTNNTTHEFTVLRESTYNIVINIQWRTLWRQSWKGTSMFKISTRSACHMWYG